MTFLSKKSVSQQDSDDDYAGAANELSPLFASAENVGSAADARTAVVGGTATDAGVAPVPPSAHSTDAPTRLSHHPAFVYGSDLSYSPPAALAADHRAADGATAAAAGVGGGEGQRRMGRTPSGGYFELDTVTPPQRASSRRSLAASLSAPHLPFPSVLSRSTSHGSMAESLASSIRIGMDLNGAAGGGGDGYYSFGLESYRRRRKRRGLWMKRIFVAFLFVMVMGMEVARRRRRRRVPPERPPTPRPPAPQPPFSTLDPVADLGLPSYARPSVSRPASIFGGPPGLISSNSNSASSAKPKPTNSWYQNFLLLPDDSEPTSHNRVYAVPHVLDAAGPVPGIRVHPPRVIGEKKSVRVDFVERHGLTLGAAKAARHEGANNAKALLSKRYEVADERYLTPLGITLKWTDEIMKGGKPSSSSSSSSFQMTSPVVRGMPYATAQYRFRPQRKRNARTTAGGDHDDDNVGDLLLPAVVSEIGLRHPPLLDGTRELKCSFANDLYPDLSSAAPSSRVSNEIKLTFDQSDFTWMVFFSKPASVTCEENQGGGPAFVLRVLDVAEHGDSSSAAAARSEKVEKDFSYSEDNDNEFEPDEGGDDGGNKGHEMERLTVRIALSNNCTLGRNPPYCGSGPGQQRGRDAARYESLLRTHSDLYPGPETSVDYDFISAPEEQGKEDEEVGAPPSSARVKFDWDVRSMRREDGRDDAAPAADDEDDENLLMFALPHHSDVFASSLSDDIDTDDDSIPAPPPGTAQDNDGASLLHCQPSLTGPACPFLGSAWSYIEPLPSLSFTAPRPPAPDLIPSLASALAQDIEYEIPEHYMRGAGDTYFSGKLLARLGRILMIGEELRELKRRWEDDGGGAEEEGAGGDDEGGRPGAPPMSGASIESPFLRRERSNDRRPHQDLTMRHIPQEYDLTSSDEDALSNLTPSSHAASLASLPSDPSFQSALDRLRSGVEIWLSSQAETPFVYDAAWGGLVSCGCLFDGSTMKCRNAYDAASSGGDWDSEHNHCPAFDDPGLNFGNGQYNDHHFHYGYHILAAAVVARFDPQWGRENFEKVLLFVRDIATPFSAAKTTQSAPQGGEEGDDGGGDFFFPPFRHKDFYAGHSWASGIDPNDPPYMNGRNQESSSEAIAAYEAVGLYGDAMVRAFAAYGNGDDDTSSLVARAAHVRDAGRLLAATELRAADRYWHVHLRGEEEDDGGTPTGRSAAGAALHGRALGKGESNPTAPTRHSPIVAVPASLYPKEYNEHVVGVMWNTMAQFQTWFGNDPFLAYGIQLLPLTAISEQRDDVKWTKNMYPSFAESCESNVVCTEQGWLILQLAVLATVGRRNDAAERALSVPPESFESAGGNGHSLTNLLWYIATRPTVEHDPLPAFDNKEVMGSSPADNTDADGVPGEGKKNAKAKPSKPITPDDLTCGCPLTCTASVLGAYAAGHSCGDRIAWLVNAMGQTEMDACARVAGMEYAEECGGCDPGRSCREQERQSPLPPPQTEDEEGRDDDEEHDVVDVDDGDCPPCPEEICHGGSNSLGHCPIRQAPYLCTDGASRGGCSGTPWMVTSAEEAEGDCQGCCKLGPECGDG